MQDQVFFELSIELFEYAEIVQLLIAENFGVRLKVFGSLEQVVCANPKQLNLYLEVLKNRLGSYIDFLAKRDPEILVNLERLVQRLGKFREAKVIRTLTDQSEKTCQIELILRNLIAISNIINSRGYKIKPYLYKDISKFYSYDLERLEKIKNITTLQRKVYCGQNIA